MKPRTAIKSASELASLNSHPHPQYLVPQRWRGMIAICKSAAAA
jgi:hypothetical protein